MGGRARPGRARLPGDARDARYSRAPASRARARNGAGRLRRRRSAPPALRVLVAPDADVLADVLDEASAVVDALLGTGFSGNEVREPYAGWIRAANRRRFEGSRGEGRGRHRKREREKARHARAAKGAPAKAKDAPFALAVDTPSGLSAQTGRVASPCFAADMTLTMLAYKQGSSSPAPADGPAPSCSQGSQTSSLTWTARESADAEGSGGGARGRPPARGASRRLRSQSAPPGTLGVRIPAGRPGSRSRPASRLRRS